MTMIETLASLQDIQSRFAAFSSAQASGGTVSADEFTQILAALSPSSSTSGTSSASSASSAGATASGSAASTTSSTDAAASDGTVDGADVVADAEKYIGVPYVLGGESTRGMDCSGLVQQTYKDLGITLPRLVHQQKTMGTAVPSLAQAQPGDLIVFKGGGHVAIYEGNNTVIHAPYPGRTVTNEKLWVGDSGIETIRRIVPSGGTATAAASTGTSSAAPASSTASTAAVQAAALVAVQAAIQADFSLLSSVANVAGASGSSATGLAGMSGLSGLAGLSGMTGSTDVSNLSSLSALSGITGSSALSGVSGLSGLSALSGISGLSGASGLTSASTSPLSSALADLQTAMTNAGSALPDSTTSTLQQFIEMEQNMIAQGQS
jgi:cell wall-associated NlpC family hydrolase